MTAGKRARATGARLHDYCKQPHTMDCFYAQLTTMRPALLSAAHRRLRNSDWADDAVSETLLAALQRRPDFAEPSRVRAWLFGILRHKLIDQLRVHLGDGHFFASHDGPHAQAIEVHDPCPRADPVHRAVDRQFIAALHTQLKQLPQLHAQAFVMRECLGKDTAEICADLAVSAGNLAVMVHRARQRLRQSLSDHHL